MACLAALAVAPVSAHAAGANQDKPNILFIVADNQSAGLLGSYGNPDILTPHIDRLATQGTRFTRVFAANGMCSPTRATLLTGLMPDQHGLHDWLNDAQMTTLPPDWSAVSEFRTVPYTLKQKGYRTAMIGKWHIGQPWKPQLGYDYWVTFEHGHTMDFWHKSVIDNGEQYPVTDQHIDDFLGKKAAAYLRDRAKSDDKPFFMQLSFSGPYMNPPTNVGPARNKFYPYYSKQPLTSFPRETINQNYIDQMLDSAGDEELTFLDRIIRVVMGKMAGSQETIANMASQNTHVDANVGRVLDALEESGLQDNTIVIYTADQGVYYGQHGLWTHTILSEPSTLHETAMHVPLIVKKPGAAQGRVENALIGQYDIPVTILSLAGIDQDLKASPGKSFERMLDEGASEPLHDAVFYEQTETRAIRTDRFAYWKRMDADFGEDRLYDMKNDPEQTRDLADDADYKDVISDLSQRMDAFYAEFSDPAYDLWHGGTAKGTLSYPEKFKARFGQDWELETRTVAPFQGED
ncbi:N-acetylgalactosamine 6-sulfate sulfatase [Salinisphaera dokdonensis CL-ES53]|uniref:N-acetylgalactosamine 6-sulfate sulfatase n=2 Tax=Salinisphaera TaxID=180541 RepID=A0ABV2AZ60_9GAMM